MGQDEGKIERLKEEGLRGTMKMPGRTPSDSDLGGLSPPGRTSSNRNLGGLSTRLMWSNSSNWSLRSPRLCLFLKVQVRD